MNTTYVVNASIVWQSYSSREVVCLLSIVNLCQVVLLGDDVLLPLLGSSGRTTLGRGLLGVFIVFRSVLFLGFIFVVDALLLVLVSGVFLAAVVELSTLCLRGF